MTQGDRKGHSVQNCKSTHFKAKIDCQSHKQIKDFCSMKDTGTETVDVPQVQIPLSLNLTESPNFRWDHDYLGKRLYCPALLIARYDPVTTF